MKNAKYISALVVVLASNMALSASWVPVSDRPGWPVYDQERIYEVAPSVYRVWWRGSLAGNRALDFFRSAQGGSDDEWDGYSHSLFFSQIDCFEGKSGILQVVHYNQSGGALGKAWSAKEADVQMTDTAPGTIGSALESAVCSFAEKNHKKLKKIRHRQ